MFLNGDHQRSIPAKVRLNWLNGYRRLNFCQNQHNLHIFSNKIRKTHDLSAKPATCHNFHQNETTCTFKFQIIWLKIVALLEL